jgi:chromosome segregation ATPase
MSSEIENLKSQLKCLRKALDAELVKKNVPSENQEEWKAVNSSVEEISNACSIQLETTKNAIDVMKSETEKLEGLYEEAVCEIQKLQLRVHELEDQRQQWKSREAELLLQINNHN